MNIIFGRFPTPKERALTGLGHVSNDKKSCLLQNAMALSFMSLATFFMDEPVLYTRVSLLWQGLVKHAQHVASHDCCDFFGGELRLHQGLGEENQSTCVHHCG